MLGRMGRLRRGLRAGGGCGREEQREDEVGPAGHWTEYCVKIATMRSQLFSGALLLLFAPLALTSASAQQTPPVHGVTGTITLKGNVDKIYDGAHKIIVKTEDGVEHVVNVTKGTKVHGTAGDSM